MYIDSCTGEMRFACRVTKARIMFNITGFPQLQPLHDRTAMLRHTHCVSCTEMSAMSEIDTVLRAVTAVCFTCCCDNRHSGYCTDANSG